MDTSFTVNAWWLMVAEGHSELEHVTWLMNKFKYAIIYIYIYYYPLNMVRHLCNLVISIFVKQVKYTSIKPLNPVYPIFAVFLSLDCIFDVFFYICQLFMGPYIYIYIYIYVTFMTHSQPSKLGSWVRPAAMAAACATAEILMISSWMVILVSFVDDDSNHCDIIWNEWGLFLFSSQDLSRWSTQFSWVIHL